MWKGLKHRKGLSWSYFRKALSFCSALRSFSYSLLPLQRVLEHMDPNTAHEGSPRLGLPGRQSSPLKFPPWFECSHLKYIDEFSNNPNVEAKIFPKGLKVFSVACRGLVARGRCSHKNLPACWDSPGLRSAGHQVPATGGQKDISVKAHVGWKRTVLKKGSTPWSLLSIHLGLCLMVGPPVQHTGLLPCLCVLFKLRGGIQERTRAGCHPVTLQGWECNNERITSGITCQRLSANRILAKSPYIAPQGACRYTYLTATHLYVCSLGTVCKNIRLQYLHIIQAQFNSAFWVLAWHKLVGLHASSHR